MMLLVWLIPIQALAAPPESKTVICHARGNGTWIAIEVAGAAVPAHLAHGDGEIGDPVPAMDWYVFGEDCALVLADSDGDGILDADDNCPDVPNPGQSDRYGSPKGDACEDDSDGDGFLDSDAVNEPHICVSIDGAVIVSRGSPNCTSTATTGSVPNIAVSHGSGSVWAINGNNNTAIANGVGGTLEAVAAAGDNNTASVDGSNSSAWATAGNSNTATVVGNNSLAQAVAGHHNSAIVTGDGGTALVWNGANNTATATGACTVTLGNVNNQTASCTGP